MYIKDGMCYAGKMKNDIKVVDCKPLKGMMMLVTFSTGEERIFDASRLTDTAFEALKDEKVFSSPVLFHGVVTWNNGEIDIAPEALYEDSCAYCERR